MKKIMIFFVGMILIIFAIIGCRYYVDKKDQIYNSRLTSVANKIYEQERICENISSDVMKTWNEGIITDNVCVDLSELYQKPNEKRLINQVDFGKSDIEAKMKLIENPSSKNKQKYDLLVQFYNKYNDLYKQIVEINISSSKLDSLDAYSEDVKDTESDFKEIKHQLIKIGVNVN
ncbi:hypothetical protein AGR56_13870 [Clostridium sp. DMHC 10]|uniref:hypothetical protein n=1 Tax=Clostridium sp. DMHC 10 TaxID=747377 RepID=UPI00069D0BD0|nr:hypothetical protein [Clostridium sp. DMHC 10]KOF57466.1 hypothetical protein AGR56_13870 [Clostridium sp. DMHC 10]